MNAFIIAWIVSVLGSGSPIVAKLNNEQIRLAGIIYSHAQEYEVPPAVLLKVAVCESNLDNAAVGDATKARGVFQFHKGTWDMMSEKYGRGLKRENAADQIFLAANILGKEKNGINHWWNCGKKLAFK